MAYPKTIRFTKQRLADLAIPERGEYEVRDEGHPALSCRVQASGSRTLQVKKRPAGKSVQVRVKVASVDDNLSLTTVYQMADEVVAKLRRGENPVAERRQADLVRRSASVAGGMTLAEALERYLKDSTKLRPNTIAEYKRSVERHLNDWQDRELKSLTREEIKARHKKIGKQYPAQANKVLSHLKLLWRFAIDEATLKQASYPAWPLDNRRDRKNVPYKIRPRKDVIRPELMPDWYTSLQRLPELNTKGDGELMRDYLWFLFQTGMRRREATTIKPSQVDLRTDILRVEETKSGEPLELPITSWVRDVLQRRLTLTKGNKSLFPLDEPKRAIAIVRKDSDVYFSCHVLRRTYITTAERLVSPYTMKLLVNHALPEASDVTSHYISLGIDDLREPAQLIGDTLAKQCGLKRPKKKQKRGKRKANAKQV